MNEKIGLRSDPWKKDTFLFIAPQHRTAFAADPIASVLARVRKMIGLPPVDLPGDVILAAVDRSYRNFDAMERAADLKASDLVLSHLGNEFDAFSSFSIGVRLHWKYLWHTSFEIWLPRVAEPALFVPAMERSEPCFRIEDGRLVPDDRMPFASVADRERGVAAAKAALCSIERA